MNLELETDFCIPRAAEMVFEAIAELMTPVEESQKKIGFELKEGKARYGKNRKTGGNV